MKKTVFLLGAGASANGLPIMTGLPDRLLELIRLLNQEPFEFSPHKRFKDVSSGKTINEWKIGLLQDFNWLAENSIMYSSIDTFAKFLYLTQERIAYRRLKIALAFFFSIEQVRKKSDHRYDSFLASVITRVPPQMPDHIQILTWNYDFQLEIAYSHFSKEQNITDIQNVLNMCAKNLSRIPDPGKFNLIKLNGIPAQKSDRFEIIYITTVFNYNFDIQTFEELLLDYSRIVMDGGASSSLLSYAWEREGPDSIVKKATSVVNDAEILVVIGYSFPFFNREIDKEILDGMKDLKKVYIQATDPEGVEERFMAALGEDRKIQIVLRRNTDYFFIPNEL